MPVFTLFEDESHYHLQPFTFTRPIFLLRSGILTFLEKWQRALTEEIYTVCVPHLASLFGRMPESEDVIWINGKFGPNEELLGLIKEIAPHSYIINEAGEILLFRSTSPAFRPKLPLTATSLEEAGFHKEISSCSPLAIRSLSDIFKLNKKFIQEDFKLITQTEQSIALSDPYTKVYGKDNLFISEGASIRAAIINAESGPIYVGKQATIMEGSVILNTHSFGAHSIVNAGAKLRGDSSIGPWSKVGGEISNSVIMGLSSKGHDGYLGNSVLGYWCNLGADTNTSNMKNNYSNIKAWDYASKTMKDTGHMFQGLMMGDHSKSGINTMFNTGTVVGVAANIYGGNFPPKFIPSFSWGGSEGFVTHNFDRAMLTAERVMARRNVELTEAHKEILRYVFTHTSAYRSWESKEEKWV